MKLTKDQRNRALDYIINSDIDQLYKRRDMYHLLYNGVVGYKDCSDDEILEILEGMEINVKDIPTYK